MSSGQPCLASPATPRSQGTTGTVPYPLGHRQDPATLPRGSPERGTLVPDSTTAATTCKAGRGRLGSRPPHKTNGLGWPDRNNAVRNFDMLARLSLSACPQCGPKDAVAYHSAADSPEIYSLPNAEPSNRSQTLVCERSLESGDLSFRPRPAITRHVSQLVTGLSLGVVATAASAAAAARRRPLPCPCPVPSIPCIQPLLLARSTRCGPSTVGKRLSRRPPDAAHSQSTSGPG
ncbi:hypothetical protein E2C01_016868 [Portunus trituberculatus]|uniref:Uncharacterized protein n=1 Tax=Portunus trituberculatus TaxID=210409 RepID=A0A5B7DS24_PORTR|nr:hypothetical protein [Portunus trituberculatus]